MAQLESGLQTFNNGSQGWNDVHNDNWEFLDDYVWKKISWQNSVKDRDLATPPPSPATNDRYIVATSPTGAWSGQAGKIAHWNGTAWYFITPTEGFLTYLLDENILVLHDGSAWQSDFLTAYALLAGRSGGQVLKGGVASGETLTLMSTNHGTKGKILFGNSAYDEVNNRLGVGNNAPTEPLDITGNIKISGEIKHNGNKVGFYGVTPVVRPSAYTISNHTDSRSLDESAPPTNAELANVLGTLINDLKLQGLLQ